MERLRRILKLLEFSSQFLLCVIVIKYISYFWNILMTPIQLLFLPISHNQTNSSSGHAFIT